MNSLWKTLFQRIRSSSCQKDVLMHQFLKNSFSFLIFSFSSIVLVFTIFLLLSAWDRCGFPNACTHHSYDFWTMADLPKMRLMHFSFFAGLALGIPLILSKVSGYYRLIFSKLPHLNYVKSLGLVLVLGLGFQLTASLWMDTRRLTDSPEIAREQKRLKIIEEKRSPETLRLILQHLRQPERR